jgi:predicted anti-sigma-YlaC factor YlaD
MRWPVFFLALMLTTACSVRKYAIKQVGGALANSSGTFSSDNDPELIRAAVPFSLKLIEALLDQTPKDPGLLYAAANGFTEYAYAFIQMDADQIEERDRAAAAAMRERAAKMYLRARDYGMRGLELKHPIFGASLKANPKTAAESLAAKDVPFMYWTALSWAGALAASRDMFMLPQIPQFEALLDRALQLDEAYDHGALHTFLITFEMASPTRRGDKAARAKQHFERALELGLGHQVGPYVSYAETVLVPAKDRTQFEEMLKKALAIDVNAEPGSRLRNIILQRRARWLLGRADKLFPK